VALPLTALLEMSTKSVTMRETTATRAGCVQRELSRAAVRSINIAPAYFLAEKLSSMPCVNRVT